MIQSFPEYSKKKEALVKSIIAVILFAVGLLNFLPIGGVLSADILSRLYGIETLEGDLLLLMRHRAVLFGILGGLMLVSVWRRSLRPVAVWTVGLSMLVFVALIMMQGGPSENLQKVFFADAAALVLLLLVVMAQWRKPKQ